MANSLLGLSLLAPTNAIGSTEAAGHPATNVLNVAKWRRTFRTTTSTNGQTLDIDLGATTAVTAIYLNSTNFTGVVFSASATQGAGTNLYTVAPTIPADERVDNRRKGIFLSAGAASGANGAGSVAWANAFNHRWLRITMSSVIGGAAYFEIGSVSLVTAMTTMLNNWKVPYGWTPIEPFSEQLYPDNAGSEVNIVGPKRWAAELEVFSRSAAALAQLNALDAVGIGGSFLLYENRGNPAHAYLLKKRNNVRFAEAFRYADAGPFVVEEAV